MKRNLLSIALVFAFGLANAQITITSTDIGQAGDSMIVGNDEPTTSMSVGGTGSQTWSFDFLVNSYNVLLFEDPANAASSASFPAADIAIERLSDTLFFKKNSSELALDGLSGNIVGETGVPIQIALNIAEDVTQIEFPSTYLDNFTDQATIDTIINCADINAATYCSQARIKRRYLVTSNIDAHGSLETSGGDYPNTIRQYYKERTIDSVWANLPVWGGPLTFVQDIDSTSHIYRWFANGEKWPVLTAYADAAGGDIITAEFQIDNLLGNITNKNNPSCNGDCNGSATVTGLGADPGYTYAWPASAGGQTVATATGLCAGTYVVTINDADTDQYELEVIIDEPSTIGIVGSQQAVVMGADGAIDITASGGTVGSGAYTYAWTGPNGFTANTQDITGLDSGTYTVVVTDDNGCTGTQMFSLIATGIRDIYAQHIDVYPNPANDLIRLESEGQMEYIKVTDLLGNTVSSKVLSGTSAQFDTSALSNGIYMIEVHTDQGLHLSKLTIKH